MTANNWFWGNLFVATWRNFFGTSMRFTALACRTAIWAHFL